ncbi:MAG: hypothetical protein JXR76_14330 [Deltaproteobacteria bacterium]|nr:hypothetical protein [Deltaproteobacteria bacterium]
MVTHQVTYPLDLNRAFADKPFMEKKNILLPDSPGSKEGAIAFLKKLHHADVPQALVQELGAHDLLLAMAEADDEQRTDLLVLASKEQFEQMVDFSCWDGYEMQLEKVEEFISPLVHSGIGGAIRALDKLNDETRTLMLQNRVIVHLREEKDEDFPDVLDTSDFITTPDGYYGIEIPDAEMCPDVIKELIRAMLFKPFEYYQKELEAIRHELKFDQMEDALRWRNARLADLGFGTFEEGLALLSPRSTKAVKEKMAKKEMPHPLDLESPVPAIYREHLSGNELLDESFALLSGAKDAKWQERATTLQAEMSAMVSLFLTGIKCNLADLDAISKGTVLARDILTLGLSDIAETPHEGAAALAYLTPGEILQVGMGLVIPLRERAKKLQYSDVLQTIQLDTPWQVVLDCVSSFIPKWWPMLDDGYASASIVEPLPDELEFITTTNRVSQAARYLDEMESLLTVLAQLEWRDGFSSQPVQPSTLILTALCNAYVDGQATLDVVPSRDAEQFTSAFLNQPVEEMLVSSLKVLTLPLNVPEEGSLSPADERHPLRRLLLRLLLIGRDRLESEAVSSAILTM